MEISYSTVLQLLNNRSKGNGPAATQIKKWRDEWTKLLDTVPNRSRASAREKNWTLYYRLRAHDPKWLFANPRNKTHRPHPEGQVDWAIRDEEWSRLLRAAATTIKEAMPLERVTRNAMITHAGITTSIFVYMNRLPACRLALSECSESREAFRGRCAAAEKSKACNEFWGRKPL